jgi:hypothetical protein
MSFKILQEKFRIIETLFTEKNGHSTFRDFRLNKVLDKQKMKKPILSIS